MKKNKYNPSGKPVLTKSSHNKGSHIKAMERNAKRLNRLNTGRKK